MEGALVPANVLAQYEAYLAKREAKKARAYAQEAGKYLRWAGTEAFTRESLAGYIRRLTRDVFEPSTIIWKLRILKVMFRVGKIPWPLELEDSPRVRQPAYAPALHPDIIKEMIATGRDGVLDEKERCFLALATTFGFRRAELVGLSPESLTEDNLLHLWVAKRGATAQLERIHLIPDAILPYITAWGFRERLTDFKMSEVYYFIEQKIGLGHIPETGWHAIRRTLDTLLVEALPLMTVRAFMGWSGNIGDMPQRYHKTTFVGREGTSRYSPGWRREIDEAVFAVHPFLPEWIGG